MSRPFEGIRVLDLTHILAGPCCSFLLALLGAETIKIEAPGEPDESRGRGLDAALNAALMGTNYLAHGANKKSLTLDLKMEAGREIFRQLVKTADVVVENFRAGALSGLGLGYGDLNQLNPRLVYCSITGFGQSGPRARAPAYDNLIQAACGLMQLAGAEDGRPRTVGAPTIDYLTGMTAAFAIAAALLRREKTGTGVQIDCPMMESALMVMGHRVTQAYLAAEGAPATGNTGMYAGMTYYETRDGVLMMGAFNARQSKRLWSALDRPDYAELSSWDDMARHAGEMRAFLAGKLKERSAAQWELYFKGLDIPAERVRTVQEALEIVEAKDVSFTVSFTTLGASEVPIRVPAFPFRYSSDGPQVTAEPPRMGQHNRELLSALGYGTKAIEELAAKGVV